MATLHETLLNDLYMKVKSLESDKISSEGRFRELEDRATRLEGQVAELTVKKVLHFPS